jgi:hypothetical protein
MSLVNSFLALSEHSNEIDVSEIVIRSYTSFGKIKGNGDLRVEANELIVIDRRHVSYSIKVILQTVGDYGTTAATLIQYENIDKTLVALDRLSAATIKSDRFMFSEIEYSIDGFTVVVFNDSKGKLIFSVKIANVEIYFSSISQLVEIRNVIDFAKRHLDKHRKEF